MNRCILSWMTDHDFYILNYIPACFSWMTLWFPITFHPVSSSICTLHTSTLTEFTFCNNQTDWFQSQQFHELSPFLHSFMVNPPAQSIRSCSFQFYLTNVPPLWPSLRAIHDVTAWLLKIWKCKKCEIKNHILQVASRLVVCFHSVYAHSCIYSLSLHM